MMSWIRNLERRRGPALMLFLSLPLAACASSPRTELAWNVNDHTYYGPQKVTLPPVQPRRVVRETSRPQRVASAPIPKSKPGRTPGWYAPDAPAQPVQAAPETEQASISSGSLHFKWPLAGRVILKFGMSESGERNDGINIAVTPGEPIHAAASGTVSYCGNELKGYGNLVLIKHDDGYITAYAHADTIVVSRGDHVVVGQVIGTAGATGDVASPQLHFEIRHGMQPLDPKALLPKAVVVASN